MVNIISPILAATYTIRQKVRLHNHEAKKIKIRWQETLKLWVSACNSEKRENALEFHPTK